MVAKDGESLGGNDLPSISTEENNIAVLLWPGYLAEKSADMGSGIHISPASSGYWLSMQYRPKL